MEKITDPTSGNVVRFTDNSAKTDGENIDYYPEDQSHTPLMLDPAGAPYPAYSVEDALDGFLYDEEMAGGSL
jgi:hypothetical protein